MVFTRANNINLTLRLRHLQSFSLSILSVGGVDGDFRAKTFPYTSHGNVLKQISQARLVLTPTLTLNDPLHSVKCTKRLWLISATPDQLLSLKWLVVLANVNVFDRTATEMDLMSAKRPHYKMDTTSAFSTLPVSFILPKYAALLCMYDIVSFKLIFINQSCLLLKIELPQMTKLLFVNESVLC